jgi:uncharacterized membrane protein (DUF373 family)
MFEYIDKFQKLIYLILMATLALVLALSVAELVWILWYYIFDGNFFLESHGIVAFLEFFLLILIGIELMDTMRDFFTESAIHVEVVLVVAIIAVARKVIVLDMAVTDDLLLIATGFVLIALCGGYYLIKKADRLGR